MHLAAQRGDLAAVRQILSGIDAQMVGTAEGEEFDAMVAEIRAAVVSEVNERGETALMIAAEKGYLDAVEELLKDADRDSVARRSISGFDALHVAAKEGHQAPPGTATCRRGGAAVEDPGLLELTMVKGKNALHLAARYPHAEVVQALLSRDPQLARRTDSKGQTPLHMAAKGESTEVSTSCSPSPRRRRPRKINSEIPPSTSLRGRSAWRYETPFDCMKSSNRLKELLRVVTDGGGVNALNREGKTAMDVADGLPASEAALEIKELLAGCGGLRAAELNKPAAGRDELRKTVTEIKNDVHTQLEQTRKTNKNVSGIAKELRKLHREGINNATNSVTVVAVLFATVAFAAVFTIFFVFNALALFTSLAVVVVQITLVRGETTSERRVVEVINKLMWLAAVCTSVAFIASSYIVVGRSFPWAAVLVTSIGAAIMGGVLGMMTFYVIKSKRSRSFRKKVRRVPSPVITATRTTPTPTTTPSTPSNPHPQFFFFFLLSPDLHGLERGRTARVGSSLRFYEGTELTSSSSASSYKML
ncbi:unnamed protein product [Spirodela intermedia]|uniref:PGG domain-containing protein n=1 Tax=Spirodela intermedia TaxID=51605 RepID=A0A7I8JGS8_SPIIN|nr:unnamed protein product [Spirodela intermedia]CAA6669350.1 unnamed protein product [Spirodela intermedia]